MIYLCQVDQTTWLLSCLFVLLKVVRSAVDACDYSFLIGQFGQALKAGGTEDTRAI